MPAILHRACKSFPSAPEPILSTPLFWNNSVYVAPGNGNLMSFHDVRRNSCPASVRFPITGNTGSARGHARHFFERNEQRHSLAD